MGAIQVTQYLAKSILSYGGFCFYAHSRSFVLNPKLDQKVGNFLHEKIDATGNKNEVGSVDRTIIAGEQNQLLLRQIFYVTHPAQDNYSFYISVNGFLSPYFSPPEENGECLIFQQQRMANVFWFAKCRQGYSVMAAFLLPEKEAEILFELFTRSANDFHSLIATIFPAYNQLYQNLQLGRAVKFEAEFIDEVGLAFQEVGIVQYQPQGIVTGVRLE